ncbi:hypothetical protein Saso_24810 [Streptomyces asoensis]|uniref:Uncharacterized protein n=1 Tax=Streptomyces asoensis TaxID=249586 RepID=A0ABQ3RY80_9ACTN|nr:hypothetical protein GCM10010496_17400 [Streptomyces asoensis]GHI60831.1 hypothetical protein Saso_24810 [Streptomyces asoensis]
MGDRGSFPGGDPAIAIGVRPAMSYGVGARSAAHGTAGSPPQDGERLAPRVTGVTPVGSAPRAPADQV